MPESRNDNGNRSVPVAEAAARVGVTPATLRRWARSGVIPQYDGQWTSAAVGHARIVARMRERGHSLAEIRLFHLYVHEPLMRSGATGLEMADEMLSLSRELLPLSSPVMDQVHQRYLQHFIEQDVVGHMEADLDGEALDLGRMRVAIAFADLAGYTRLTEEVGELEAVDAVERFVSAVEFTLPDEARVIKTIGDEVMIAGPDPSALTDWAVGFQRLHDERPEPRIGIHFGDALYRDGDYYGRDVNIASRVAARSAAGEVLVTRPIVEAA